MARLEIEATGIPEVRIIRPRQLRDQRGSFAETYNKRDFEELGIEFNFVQDNQSYSVTAGTIRGLHFQIPPVAQAKLVRVASGAVLDVAVDIRAASPTFGQYVARVLSGTNQEQLLIPEGFAHGFCTLESDTIVVYKVSNFYSPSHERGIRWDDSRLAIDWQTDPARVVLSERDQHHPAFDELPIYFEYQPKGAASRKEADASAGHLRHHAAVTDRDATEHR
jgi:dTDP-4-dehydrorhamnose 3,5-epimerase